MIQAGDTVRCVDAQDGFAVGNCYEVFGVNQTNDVFAIDDNGALRIIHMTRFEKVEEECAK